MANKKIKILTPTRINEYNKFLITMDKKATVYHSNPPSPSPPDTNKILCDTELKNELDKLVVNIK